MRPIPNLRRLGATAVTAAITAGLVGVVAVTAVADPPNPDPGPPPAYVSVEEVYLREYAGYYLAWPTTVWGVPFDGPLQTAVPVTWIDTPSVINTPGEYEFHGITTLGGVPVVAYVSVTDPASPWTMAAVESWDRGTITTPGVAPVCPHRAPVTFADGSVETRNVAVWSVPPLADYDEEEDWGVLTAPVGGTAITASCYYSVVPESRDPEPFVFVDWLSEPEVTGWYTSAPVFSLSLERGDPTDPIATVDYSTDGVTTWVPYELVPVTIDREGTFSLEVRAVSAGGYVRLVDVPLQVDTTAPLTTAVVESISADHRTVTVKLTPDDGPDGSGIARTVFAVGTGSTAGSGNNGMWGDYDPATGIVFDRDDFYTFYVYWRSQDVAGNTEPDKDATTRLEFLPFGYWAVTWELNGHGDPIAPTDVSNDNVTPLTQPPDPAEVGYVFDGWYSDAALSIPYDFSAPVTSDMTLYAKWSANAALALGPLLAAAAAVAGNQAMYTTSSWTALQIAVADAEALVTAASTDAAQIDAARDALASALLGLQVRVNPAGAEVVQLQVLIALANQNVEYQQSHSVFTPQSFADLVFALDDAEDLLADLSDVARDDVIAAAGELRDALENLESAVSVSALQHLIDYAESVIASGVYTPATLAGLSAAVAAANALVGSPNPSAIDLFAAAQSVLAALAELTDLVDLQALTALIAFAESLNPEDYSPASWAAVAREIADSRAITPTSSAQAATQAYDQLRSALGNLVVRAVKTGLNTAIALAQSVMENFPLYAPASVAPLGPALIEARAVRADANATQEQVDAAEQHLLSVLASARYRASTAGLLAVVQTVPAFPPSQYTPDSFAAMLHVLATAEGLLADPDATQEAVDASAKALVRAIGDLVPVASSASPDPAPSIPALSNPVLANPVLANPNPAGALAAPFVVRVKAAQSVVTLVKGQSVRLAATAYLSDGAKAAVTWTSSDAKVAKVAPGGRITAHKPGKARLTLASASGKTATVAVRVLAAKPAQAKVAKVRANVPKVMAIGQVKAVSGKYAPALAVRAKVSYASTNPGVASIDKYGMLTAHRAGKAAITVKAGAKTATYPVTVR
jgi:uncharacterized repeat protein (TIGR02543 family)